MQVIVSKLSPLLQTIALSTPFLCFDFTTVSSVSLNITYWLLSRYVSLTTVSGCIPQSKRRRRRRRRGTKEEELGKQESPRGINIEAEQMESTIITTHRNKEKTECIRHATQCCNQTVLLFKLHYIFSPKTFS